MLKELSVRAPTILVHEFNTSKLCPSDFHQVVNKDQQQNQQTTTNKKGRRKRIRQCSTETEFANPLHSNHQSICMLPRKKVVREVGVGAPTIAETKHECSYELQTPSTLHTKCARRLRPAPTPNVI